MCGKIKLNISSETDFILRLRVPEWSKKTALPVKARLCASYAEIDIAAGESELEIGFDMSIRETLPEKWDLDVLYINTCGTRKPPVPVRHYDEDDNFISLSRGPITLAADSSLGKPATDNFSFKSYDYRVCEDEKYTLKLEFTAEDGEKFYLVDYQSAGKDWESEIAAWMPSSRSEQ